MKVSVSVTTLISSCTAGVRPYCKSFVAALRCGNRMGGIPPSSPRKAEALAVDSYLGLHALADCIVLAPSLPYRPVRLRFFQCAYDHPWLI